MTDPRLIALSSNPGQVEPGPFSEDELRKQWNAQAHEFNQWESLDFSEQLAWAQTRAIATITHAIPVALCRSDDFCDAAQKHLLVARFGISSDCDMALYEHPQANATTPGADQAEGPSLADVAELCEEFGFMPGNNGALLAADVFRAPPISPLPMLHDMITAAITRWRPLTQPAAQPVDVANLMRLTEGVAPFAPGDPDVDHILTLAAIIREVDGKHELGAAVLAEAILAHPGFGGCHDGPAALPAPDHVNLIGFAFGREPWATWLRQGGCLESAHCELSDLMLSVLAKWGRPAALPAPGFQIGPQEYIPHA